MNTLKPSFWSNVTRLGRLAGLSVVIAASALLLTPTPVQAARVFVGGRAFVGGGRGFLGGLGFGLGVGLGRSFFYAPPYYAQSTIVYASPPPVYYVPQAVPQNTIVYAAPPAVAAPSLPVAAPAAPVSAPTTGKLSKILYDGAGKPVGVLVLNNDGTQEFVPLAQ